VPPREGALLAELLERGVSRRSFMKFCAAMTAVLALPATYVPRVAAAVAAAPRLPVLWIRAQACGADGEAFLRAANPTTAELFLQFLSVDYLESLMVASGADASAALADSVTANRDGYLVIVEGSVPTAADGAMCTVAGRPIADVIREVSAGAAGTISVGSCAFDGGLNAAAGGATGASGAGGFVRGKLVALPGCPVNAFNLAATIVHYLTFKELPATDAGGRPLFAYGALIHNECERRAHFEFGEFVQAWGDEGAQKGWCLYKMGCKGPESFGNCASAGFDGGLSWPVKAGVGCIGCTMPAFWDSMAPFTRRLPAPLPFLPGLSADDIGQAAVAGIAGVAGLHAVGSFVRAKRQGAAERRLAAATPTAASEPVTAELITVEPVAPVPVTADPTIAPDADADAAEHD
jgi:hydrogenase small subunit